MHSRAIPVSCEMAIIAPPPMLNSILPTYFLLFPFCGNYSIIWVISYIFLLSHSRLLALGYDQFKACGTHKYALQLLQKVTFPHKSMDRLKQRHRSILRSSECTAKVGFYIIGTELSVWRVCWCCFAKLHHLFRWSWVPQIRVSKPDRHWFR